MIRSEKKNSVVTQADRIKGTPRLSDVAIEKAKLLNEQKLLKKELEIDNMTPELVLSGLKNKGLPAFGTAGQRKERLKRHYGIPVSGTTPQARTENTPPAESALALAPRAVKRSGVVGKIEEMKQKRDERRKKMEENKKIKLEREAENLAVGKMGDVDFEMMIEKYRLGADCMHPHQSPESIKINICVRKRPLFKKESTAGEIDCVSVANPRILVHECKFRVDGITKYLDNQDFQFDNVRRECGQPRRRSRTRNPRRTCTSTRSSLSSPSCSRRAWSHALHTARQARGRLTR